MSIEDQLRQAGERLNNDLHEVTVPVAPHRRPGALRTALVFAMLTIVVVGSALWFVREERDPAVSNSDPVPTTDGPIDTPETTIPEVSAAPEDPRADVEPLFGFELPWVLLFDDGIDGVVALDPNSRVGSRRAVEGQGAGDQPYRLHLTNGRLVVGWGEIYSVNVQTGKSNLLDTAVIYVPAAEPDRVWMIDYPGGRISNSNPTVWQASALTGDRLTEPVTLEVDGFPGIGIPGGLAIETDSGVALWDAESASVTRVLGTGNGFVSDISPDVDNRLAWCEDDCTEMHITNLVTMDDLVATHPDGVSDLDARGARFSNDRRFIAVPAGSDVIVLDLETGQSHSFELPGTGDPSLFVAWAPSGPDLFAASYGYGADRVTVAYHRALGSEASIVELPFGGTLSFVVLDASQGQAFLKDEPQDPEDCPAVIAMPSGREGICGFRF